MGLAGQKNKRKFSKDPNNTKWARKTDSFGQKFMRSQGWEPGQYLGAKDAAQSDSYTAANSSHIRVLLKDDNLGIGAKRNQGDQCTGLDVFKDLLGRLNGKSDVAIQEERQAREDVKMSHYVQRKFGPMRFVKGGLLVGDKIQELLEQQAKPPPTDQAEAESTDSSASDAPPPRKDKKSKKRKAETEEEDGQENGGKKKKKKRKKSRAENSRARDGSSTPDSNSVEESASLPEDAADVDAEARRRKKEKKDKKKRRKEAETGETASDKAERRAKKKEKQSLEDAAPPKPETGAPVALSRHVARRKFIASKRRAMMDPQALNQIFMIKA